MAGKMRTAKELHVIFDGQSQSKGGLYLNFREGNWMSADLFVTEKGCVVPPLSLKDSVSVLTVHDYPSGSSHRWNHKGPWQNDFEQWCLEKEQKKQETPSELLLKDYVRQYPEPVGGQTARFTGSAAKEDFGTRGGRKWTGIESTYIHGGRND